jgi:hypothetical protein
MAGRCVRTHQNALAIALNCAVSPCGISPELQAIKAIPDDTLAVYFVRLLGRSVFAQTFAASLQHETIPSKRQVLDINCGCGCWSLMLAGPTLHVTVIVNGHEARLQALRIAQALDVSAHVTVLQCSDTASAQTFLSVLGGSAAVQEAGFLGFEMVFILDLLKQLPASLLREFSVALRPYMHTRSKAFVTAMGISAAAESAFEWY